MPKYKRGEYSSIVGIPIMREDDPPGMLCAGVFPRRDKDEAIAMADAMVAGLNAMPEKPKK